MICPVCEKGELRRKLHMHAERIGRYTVRDGSMFVETCAKCGQAILSASELTGYQLRAGAVVLRDAKVIEGPELKAIRKAMGLTQAELGELLGRDVATLSRQENDAQPMTRTDQLALIAILEGIQQLGGDVEAFVEHEHERSTKKTFEIRKTA